LLESYQRTDIVLGSTEPVNYRGSNTARSREIVDLEITMHRNAGIVIECTIAILPETNVKSRMEILLQLSVSEEKRGLRS
jgi:hypothetical protein